MQFTSTQKFIRTAPRKLRLVASQAKKLSPAQALEILPLTPKRAADPVYKVIKSAVANAAQAGVSVEELKFAEIQIGEGPRLKRGLPVSRGRWHPILKRMSHIRVVLETMPAKKSQDSNSKSQTISKSETKKQNDKNVKKTKSKKGGK